MGTKIFVNLPVRDLPASMAFYRALGFSFNPHFSDETAACLVISDDNYVMLLTHEKFQGFSGAPIPDARSSTGLMIAIALAGKAEVDQMAKTAVAAGGGEPRPAMDMGFMYTRTISDPDGHRWEPFWMDPAAIPQG
ncbi:MAG: hypothetical protein LCH46_08770 [Proteobacteria bacterium]|nr:hypothetical protein [Pseudomonadota bacterium]